MSTCSIEGCNNPKWTRGFCPKHYWRFRRHGDPLICKHKREDPWCNAGVRESTKARLDNLEEGTVDDAVVKLLDFYDEQHEPRP